MVRPSYPSGWSNVKNFFRNPVVAFFSSLKFGAVLMFIAGVASGVGTFIESFYGGRDAAYGEVYAAGWFELLLALITLNLVLVFFKRMPYSPRQSGSVVVHLAIIVILVAAAVTRYQGYEGIVSIREGETATTYLTEKSYVQVQVDRQRAYYSARLYKHGEPGLEREVMVNNRTYKLGVSEFWPNYTEVYQEGEGGRPGLQYGIHDGNEVVTKVLLQGDRAELGQVRARFLKDGFEGEVSGSAFGDVRVRAGGESCTIPVGLPDGTVHSCGGYDFEIIEFQTDYSVGEGSSDQGPLNNPMVRLEVTGPDGTDGEKILFAFHPDFSMGHGSGQGGGEDVFAELDVLYSLNSGLQLARGGETGMQGRASFPLTSMDMADDSREEIPAGTVFPIREAILYLNDGLDFSFIPAKIMSSVVLAPVNGDNPNLRSAAMVTVQDDQGNRAEALCIAGEPARRVDLNGESVKLSYGRMTRPLGYSLHLDDFVLETYPGSDNPATYESYVTLNDPEKGIQNRKVHIYMNNPLTHRGSKHFQSSYDPDRRGTVLSLNHDPGKIPTYIGYAMISVGFVLVLLQNLLFPRRRNGGAGTAAALLAGVLALAGSGAALAQGQDDHAGHDHAGHDHAAPPPPSFTVLSDPARDMAAELIIQDFRGRMKPLDTQAREFVMKVAKKTKFQDRQPVDMYLNWVANPRYWWQQPCIAVRYGGLKDFLGVDASVKHVSPASLFVDGKYRIAEAVEEAHRTPDRERSKTQRKLISFDERFNLLYMTFRGDGMRLYPIPGHPNDSWDVLEKVLPSLDDTQKLQYQAAFGALMEGLQSGNNARIMEGLEGTRDIQSRYGASVLPGKTKLAAELFYNKSHLFSWMMVPLLGCFFLFMALFIWSLLMRKGAAFSFRNPLYSLGMLAYVVAFAGMIAAYVLRWIASGRAPLSNGHESLLFISLAVVLAGLIFELIYRMAAPAGLASLLTLVVLGVSMLSVFDPAIGPLVPVLVSYWLNIHVTIITASYAFLGMVFMVGTLILILMIIRSFVSAETKADMDGSIAVLDRINFWVLVAGLGTLTIGTLLGGVWANESWGRYWGWDPKETWSLVTILVAAVGLHFRYIPAMRGVWINSVWGWMILNSVMMTYFGVNYFLTGLHSYASGDAATIPGWVYIFTVAMGVLVLVSGMLNMSHADKKRLAERTSA